MEAGIADHVWSLEEIIDLLKWWPVNSKRKQLIVLVIGLTLILSGAVVRLTIRHGWFREPLCLLTSLGGTKFSTQTPYGDAVEAVSTMGMGVFFAGLVIVVTSIAAWLFLPSSHDNARSN